MNAPLSKTTIDPASAAIALQALNDVTDEHLRQLEAELTADWSKVSKLGFADSLHVTRDDPWPVKRTNLVKACAYLLREIELGDMAAEGGAA